MNVEYFDAAARQLVGRRMMIPDSGLQFYPAIDIDTTEFITIRLTGEKEVAFKIAGLTMAEAKIKLADFWRKNGLDTLSFEQTMHYEIPTYDFASKKIGSISKAARDEWTSVRSQVNTILSEKSGENTLHSLVRIWPHHFDTGFYHECEDSKGIGVGFAMKDSISDQPYFYVAAFEKNKFVAIECPPNAGNGQWMTEGDWKGAFYPVDNSRLDQKKINLWLNKTYTYFLETLGLEILEKYPKQ
ncbi:MAG: hypothetical protein P8O05_05695 [Flavobacteriales bacterium]|nr:hypothetical protein [Flavobacteriales bacterium]